MRRWMVALCVCAGGCATDTEQLADAGWSRLKPRLPGPTPDVVEIQYYLIERPIGDPQINQAAWEEADEQAISLDLKNQLDQNGLRIGKLTTRLPESVAQLLAGAGQGRRNHGRSGAPAKLTTIDGLDDCRFVARLNDEPTEHAYAKASGSICVVPTLDGSKSIALVLFPQVEFGDSKPQYVPTADYDAWQINVTRDKQAFHELAAELSLESGTYLLIGCRPENRDSLGRRLFTGPSPGRPTQRLLVLRALRPSLEELYTAGYDMDDFFLSPVERQLGAGRSTARETALMIHR